MSAATDSSWGPWRPKALAALRRTDARLASSCSWAWAVLKRASQPELATAMVGKLVAAARPTSKLAWNS